MTEKTSQVTVQVKYKNVEKTVSGSLEETWILLNKFFSEFIPSFEIANNLWLSVDLQKIAKECEGLIAFSPEGSNVLAAKNKLTDNEAISLWLLASYLGQKLGALRSESLSKEELQIKLGKSGKITSTRLGELVKTGFLTKAEEEKFKITTFGIAQMQKEILPRIKSKINT